jgi:hypothetical protein
VTYWGTERVLLSDAVELLVTTSEEIPALAVTPSLIVGEVPLGEYEPVGPNRYLFVAAQPERLQEGAPISLGWPDRPKTIRMSRFTYRAPEESA